MEDNIYDFYLLNIVKNYIEKKFTMFNKQKS